MEFTKGELGGWRNQGGTIMTDSHNNRKVIARVENNKAFTVEQVIANAHLIAAAPDLYEALRLVYNHDLEMPPALLAQVMLALTKVEDNHQAGAGSQHTEPSLRNKRQE